MTKEGEKEEEEEGEKEVTKEGEKEMKKEEGRREGVRGRSRKRRLASHYLFTTGGGTTSGNVN